MISNEPQGECIEQQPGGANRGSRHEAPARQCAHVVMDLRVGQSIRVRALVRSLVALRLFAGNVRDLLIRSVDICDFIALRPCRTLRYLCCGSALIRCVEGNASVLQRRVLPTSPARRPNHTSTLRDTGMFLKALLC